MQAGRGGARHLGQGGVGDVRRAGQLAGPELVGLGAHSIELVVGDPAEDRRRSLGHGVDDDQVAEALEQVLDEAARIVPGLDDAVHGIEDGAGVTGRHGFDDVVEERRMGVPEERDGEFVVEAVLTGTGHQLVEDGEGIADGTPACADHQREHPGRHGHVLLAAEKLEVRHEGLRRNEPERVVVRAGPDGADDLVGLRGGEDEEDVLRRLLDDLQQGVEARRRDHVGLVDDEDLEAVADGREGGTLAEVAGIVDATVTGGVDLDDVEAAGAVTRQFDAAVTRAARCGGGPLGAVEAAGQDAGGGGLAAAAWAREQVGVIDAVLVDGRHQGFGDMLLADDVREGLGTVAAVEGCTHG